jgi:hypothetical protein
MSEEKQQKETNTSTQEETQKAVSNKEVLSPIEKGKSIAQATQASLGKNLMQAIGERGSAGAVEFCNIQALPITDSLAEMHNANVKRVSDKNRNPKNAANEAELTYIKNAKSLLASNQNIKPQIKEENGKWVGYYPILTKAMCLQCHGKTDQINKETIAKIEKHYPNDQATGYGANEVRGIWVIELKK